MKTYNVILTSLIDPIKGIEKEKPDTKEYHFDINASSKNEAIDIAKQKHPLSVWESEAYEN